MGGDLLPPRRAPLVGTTRRQTCRVALFRRGSVDHGRRAAPALLAQSEGDVVIERKHTLLRTPVRVRPFPPSTRGAGAARHPDMMMDLVQLQARGPFVP